MGIGVLPKWNMDDLKIMPKERYKIMQKYMKKSWGERLGYDDANYNNSS